MKETATKHGPRARSVLAYLSLSPEPRGGWYYQRRFTKEKLGLRVNNSPKVTWLARDGAEIQRCISVPPNLGSSRTYPSLREHLFLLEAPK